MAGAHALRNLLLKTVSDEYARYGITVNTVAPGWIETAALIAYLCSEAAGYVTGNWIEVDGGLHRSAF